jgi:hypothetical protein
MPNMKNQQFKYWQNRSLIYLILGFKVESTLLF